MVALQRAGLADKPLPYGSAVESQKKACINLSVTRSGQRLGRRINDKTPARLL